jgi:hypothetical protein
MSTVIGAWARIMRHASQTGYEASGEISSGAGRLGSGRLEQAETLPTGEIGIKIVGISEEIKAHLLTITKRWK